MTLRAIILGLCGAAFICGATYFNNFIISQTSLVGHYMPTSIYGGLILFILFINPLLAYLSRRLRFTSKELAVALTLVLASCFIPAAGLMRFLPSATIIPYSQEHTNPGWKQYQTIEKVPNRMMVDVSQDKDDVSAGFVNGLSQGQEHISLAQVPWRAWLHTLLFWLPLVLSLAIALIGLSLVVHRQWSDHENLPYPIAKFTNLLLPASPAGGPNQDQPRSSSVVSHGTIPGGGMPPRGQGYHIFRDRLFWLAAGIILVFYSNNYLYAWFPSAWFEIPRGFDFKPFGELWSAFSGSMLLEREFYFTFIGIAYLLAADVSFSIGIAPFIWVAVCFVFLSFGINLGATIEGHGSIFVLRLQTFLSCGAYLGLAITIFYLGRYYYCKVFRRALGLRSSDRNPPEQQAVWGARVFLAFTAIFFLQIVLVGLDWPIALFYTALTIVTFLGISRILAETGVLWIQTWFTPGLVIWGIFGVQALGPQAMIIMFLLSLVILIDPREALMPFMVNAFKLLDLQKVKIGKTAIWCIVAIILGLIIAVPVTLYLQYDRGYEPQWGAVANWNTWSAFANATWASQKLDGQGILEQTDDISGWQRFTHMRPDLSCVIALLAGVGLIILLVGIRLRWSKWPLHPVILLIWCTYAGMVIYASFLLGWLIKVAVTKYGGIKIYQKLKPFMIGLIAGEIAAGFLSSIVGGIYYLITGVTPPDFRIFPF